MCRQGVAHALKFHTNPVKLIAKFELIFNQSGQSYLIQNINAVQPDMY